MSMDKQVKVLLPDDAEIDQMLIDLMKTAMAKGWHIADPLDVFDAVFRNQDVEHQMIRALLKLGWYRLQHKWGILH